jgi:hypothetical protein
VRSSVRGPGGFAPGRDQSEKFLPAQDPARFCVVPGKFSGPETNALDRLGRAGGGWADPGAGLVPDPSSIAGIGRIGES